MRLPRSSGSLQFGVALTVLALLLPAPADGVPGLAAGESGAAVARAAWTQPIEQDLKQGTVGLLKSVRWWYRGITRTVTRAIGTWRHVLPRMAFYVAMALLAAVVDRHLLARLHSHGWRAVGADAGRAAVVYGLCLFDRRAGGIARWGLIAALLYGFWVWDLVPDRGWRSGLLDDLVIIGAASRWFMASCSSELVAGQARRVEGWLARTREIAARRRRIRQASRQMSRTDRGSRDA